jgi:hypothetical protein
VRGDLPRRGRHRGAHRHGADRAAGRVITALCGGPFFLWLTAASAAGPTLRTQARPPAGPILGRAGSRSGTPVRWRRCSPTRRSRSPHASVSAHRSNGSKSTLLLLGGLIEPDAEASRLKASELARLTPRERARTAVAPRGAAPVQLQRARGSDGARPHVGLWGLGEAGLRRRAPGARRSGWAGSAIDRCTIEQRRAPRVMIARALAQEPRVAPRRADRVPRSGTDWRFTRFSSTCVGAGPDGRRGQRSESAARHARLVLLQHGGLSPTGRRSGAHPGASAGATKPPSRFCATGHRRPL